jgi:hypothetical protein
MYMRDLACCTNGMAFYSTPTTIALGAPKRHENRRAARIVRGSGEIELGQWGL